MAFDPAEISLRQFAVEQSVKFLSVAGRGLSTRGLLETADAIYEYCRPTVQETAALRLKRLKTYDQTTGQIAHQATEDYPVATTLTDTQQVDYTVEADDAKGYPVVDNNALTATIDDTAVATVRQNGNTLTVVAGAPGNAVLTVTDGTVTVIEAINVVSGSVAAFQLIPGTITDQPASTPPPVPTA